MIKPDLLADLLAIELPPKIRRRIEHYADAPEEVWSVIFEEDRDDVALGDALACWVLDLHGLGAHVEDVRTFALLPGCRHAKQAHRRAVATAVQATVCKHGGWVPHPVPNRGQKVMPAAGTAPIWAKKPWAWPAKNASSQGGTCT